MEEVHPDRVGIDDGEVGVLYVDDDARQDLARREHGHLVRHHEVRPRALHVAREGMAQLLQHGHDVEAELELLHQRQPRRALGGAARFILSRSPHRDHHHTRQRHVIGRSEVSHAARGGGEATVEQEERPVAPDGRATHEVGLMFFIGLQR